MNLDDFTPAQACAACSAAALGYVAMALLIHPLFAIMAALAGFFAGLYAAKIS